MAQLTTVELIDALEAGIAAARSRNGNSGANSVAPDVLRAEMSKHQVSVADLAQAAGLSSDQVNAWIEGGLAIPSLALAVTRLLAELTPSSRRKVLDTARPETRPHRENTHPFSRIEEL